MVSIGTDFGPSLLKNPLRVGLTGAGGTGKTSLANALAINTGLVYLPSHIKNTGLALGMENYKDVQGLSGALAFQYSILFGQIYQERALQIARKGYVTDRTTIDYVPYFKARGIMRKDYVDPYVKAAIEWAQANYDLVIYCPLENWQKGDDRPHQYGGDTWRERERAAQEETDQAIYELWNQVARIPLLVVHGNPGNRLRLATAFVETS